MGIRPEEDSKTLDLVGIDCGDVGTVGQFYTLCP